MTGNWKSAIARRPVLAGMLGLLGIIVLSGGIYEGPRLLRRRYKPSPFDDVLANLPDRDSASRVGAAVVAATPGFDAHMTAHLLRARLAEKPLADAIAADLVQDRMVEARGWVLPETLASLYALAATAT
jgi:hypothetical protein